MSELKSLLLWPVLPPAARLRLRQQRLDAEAARHAVAVFGTPDVGVRLDRAVDGRGTGEEVRLFPKLPGGTLTTFAERSDRGQWYTFGGMVWDGRRITVTSRVGRGASWAPASGGLLPAFDAVEVFRAGRRPVGSGEYRDRVAAIAAVGLAGHHLHRVVFLDAESHDLGWIPALGFAEDDLVRFAEAGGVAYRGYALILGKFSSLRVSPSALCEALFPRSARRARLVGSELQAVEGWYSEGRGAFGV